MGAGETFDFNSKDFEQAVIKNPSSVNVLLRDSDNNDYELEEGASFEISGIPSKSLSGLTVVTQGGGSAKIIYVQ